MNPLAAALAPCVDLMNAWGRPWALIGGAALIAQVRTRLTDVLDLAISVEKGREQAFLDLALQRGFTWLTADTAMFIEGGLLRARSPGGDTVDLLVGDDPLLQQVIARAQTLDIAGLPIPTATVEDLLLMKLDANRPLDLDDAIAIKDARGDSLDRRYLREAGLRFELLRPLENLLGGL